MITDYTSLKASVISRMARADITDADASEWVALAEAELSNKMRDLRRMRTKTTLTANAGDMSVDLPSDYLSKRALTKTTATPAMTQTSLDLLDNSFIGEPTYYDVADKIYFAPTADGTYTFNLFYSKLLPALQSNATNWLLSEYPHIYLHACMYQAYKAKRNTEQATNYLTLQNDDIATLMQNDDIGSSYIMAPATCP